MDKGSERRTNGRGGQQRPGRRSWHAASVFAILALLAGCGSSGSRTQATSSTRQSGGLSVKSSLTGHTTLPHRVHWTATPSVPGYQISEVEFLIDGRLTWVEQQAPYCYGSDGNFLVTSFLRPGQHAFTVKAVAVDGKTASTTVRASVPVAPAPPSALAGTWKQFQKSQGPGSPPTGTWRAVINRVGGKSTTHPEAQT